MLMYIRDKATGWLAWVIVILISIPFALWGVNEYLGPNQNVAVAQVNGDDISYTEFQRSYARTRNQLIRLLGSAANSELLNEDRIRAQTMERVVNEALMLQVARNTGMRIGDEQLALRIDNEEVFREGGVFSQARYESFLRSQGYSPLGYEHELRRAMLQEQFSAAVAAAAVISDGEFGRVLALRDQKRRFREIVVQYKDYESGEVDDAALQEYFNANRDRFVTPEQVKLRYVEVVRSAIASDIPVDESELRQRYESRKSSYVTEEQRQASHILFQLDAQATEEQAQTVMQKAQAVVGEIASGAAFEDLAVKHSEDPGSSDQGGALDWFGRGVMDPAFEDAAFALEEGAVSVPVRSEFGYHLIKLTGLRPSKTREFEAVEAELETEYRNEQAEQLFFGRAESLANAAFEHPESLESAAEAINSEVLETGFVSRDLPRNPEGIGHSPRVVEAAFNPEVQNGSNSELLELSDDRVVVIRVLEHQSSKAQRLDDVREEVGAAVKLQRARDAATRIGKTLLSQLQGGSDMNKAASDIGLAWSDPRLQGRQGGAQTALSTALFGLKKPDSGEVVYHGLELPSGDYTVLALDRVDDGSADKLSSKDRELLERSLVASIGQAELAAMIRGLRDAATVRIIDQGDDQ